MTVGWSNDGVNSVDYIFQKNLAVTYFGSTPIPEITLEAEPFSIKIYLFRKN